MTSTPSSAPYGALILRIALGALFIAHFALKLFVFTPAGAAAFFGRLGLPPALAYVTMAAELLGGLALILGIYARAVALALIPLLLGTIVLVHGANGFFFDGTGGGWEYPAFWSIALLVLALIGDGAHALVPTRRN
ncbi:MAG: DoxX family protein [Novosphingobium lindaniclasticum]|jgi:putative oxidoreductase|uniref:DoxX family protein n=1 Tax=Novosphingobium lindaniclasticum TaxID=1329895 RepID=UPI0024093AB7|nr:DoxX family protein [Novosphingobium lindaniclasticum]MDF2637223.1 DoxX family protein [Novosphingobium lindaniclasticum]